MRGPLPGQALSGGFARVAAVGAVVLAMSLGTWLAGALPAHAAEGTTRYVAPTGHDTDNTCTDVNTPCGTIQYAVDQAAAGDTISLAAGTYSQNVHIRISLLVTGAGSDQTIIDGADGDDPSVQVDGVDTENTTDVAIRDLAISNHRTSDGVRVTDASVLLQDCDVSNNSGDGIDVWWDGGDHPAGVGISHCSINDNDDAGVVVDTRGESIGDVTAEDLGVSIDHSTINGNQGGGVVAESGAAVVGTSTLDHNVGAGVVADGDGATAVVTESTISNTQPFADVEGTHFGGGVLVFPGGTATVHTSTLVGNTGQGVLNTGGQVVVANSTITGTKQGLDEGSETPLETGAVVFQGSPQEQQQDTAPSLALSGTLLSDNDVPNCTGEFVDAGYNLSDTDGCGFDTSTTGSINSGDALLGALMDNGGPTLTQSPAKGSDAIDAIPVGKAACSADNETDQRGDARPAGSACDIGAVEVVQPPIVVTPATLPHGRTGVRYDVTLQATGGLGAPYSFQLSSGDLPPGLRLSTAGKITGTPTAAGTFSFTIAVDDPTYQDFVIVVDAPPPTTVTSTSTTISTSTTTSTVTSTTASTSTVTSTSTSTSTTRTTAPSTSSSPSVGSTTTPPTSAQSSVAPSSTTTTGPALADTGVPAAGMVGVGGTALLLGLGFVAWAGGFRYALRRRRH